MIQHCYKHQDAETALRCGNCDRPICVKCVVQHPVGIRCEGCVNLGKLPMFNVTPVYYARAVLAAVGIGIASVIALVLVGTMLFIFRLLGIYLWWLAVTGVGYLMGCGVNLAVNRKRGRGLQWVAGLGVVATALVASLILGQVPLAAGILVVLLALGVATYVAVVQLQL